MSITSDLEQILSARYGKDVRQAIHDSIEEGYNIAVQAQGIAETSQESAKAYAQAALASEQAAEDYKTAAEQAAEQAMSGTPEGYADLVAKVNSIYRQTATSYNVVGTSEGSALAHTIYGMSVQDGTPTPDSPVEIQSAKADFRCTGKNLIDLSQGISTLPTGITTALTEDGGIHISGQRTDSGTSDWGLNYTIKGLKKRIAYKFTCNQYAVPRVGMYHVSSNITKPTTFAWTQDDDGTFTIYIAKGVTYDVTIYPMLTLEDADQTYEPYQHTDATTGLTLRAIEVASTDDYNLARDGKYYIADTIDWSEDKGYVITRRVKQAVVDGSNVKATYYQQITLNGVNVKQINLTDTSNDVIKKAGAYVLSNILESVTYSARKVNSILIANNDGIIASYYDTDMPFSSITTFNTWAQNNPFIINYVLATPTTEPITSEQAQALLSLKTYDEASYISSTGSVEPSVDLEYAKSEMGAKALTGHNLGFKNALKLNDINTALIEMGGN